MRRMQVASLGVLAVLCAGTAVHAQPGCSAETARRGRDAKRDSVVRAVSEAQAASIRSAAAAAGVENPQGVVYFSVEPSGRAPFVRTFGGNVPVAALNALIPEMQERVKQLPRSNAGRMVLLTRLDTLPLPPARADGARIECRPLVTNRQYMSDGLNEWYGRQGGLGRGALTVVVNLLVSREGKVLHSEIQGKSGYVPLDDIALELSRTLIFRPAAIDGVTREVLVTLPVKVDGSTRSRGQTLR